MRRSTIAGVVIALLAASTRIAWAAEPDNSMYNWSGFYTGLNAGWNLVRTSNTGVAASSTVAAFPPLYAPISQPFADSPQSSGAIGGLQVGYNWQGASNWIVGLEADFQAAGEGATANNQTATAFTFGPVLITEVQTVSHTDTLDWLGTVRGRLGYAVMPGLMIYGTGGLAYGRVSNSTSASFVGTATFIGTVTTSANSAFNASTTRTGWTAGGGVAGAVPNTPVSWKVEYLYVDLGTANYSFSDPNFSVAITSKLTDNIVRAGFDLHY